MATSDEGDNDAASTTRSDTASEGASADTQPEATADVQADVTADADTPEQLTTVDGFDLEKVQTLIDTSDLPATQKTLLKNGLATAAENPDTLRVILAQIREALAL
jgi:hypothetical protein